MQSGKLIIQQLKEADGLFSDLLRNSQEVRFVGKHSLSGILRDESCSLFTRKLLLK